MTSDYRLSPAFGARLLGLLLLLLALLVFASALLVAVLDLPSGTVLVVAVFGVLGVVGVGYWLTRRVYVVHLGEQGYRVSLVRGAGVTSAGWTDVEDAVTATLRGVPCVVLRLNDGRSTTIPMPALAGDQEAFVRDLQQRLQHGHGLRPP